MIYKIDLKNYLMHMVDYFPLDDLIHFQYLILSAKITNGGRLSNVSKISGLYPLPEDIATYIEYKDKDMFEKMYFDFLDPDEEDKIRMRNGGSYFIYNLIYKTFISPLNNHYDILILCDESENYIIDALCKYLKKKFKIEIADLNQLFEKGEIDSIYLDRKEINKNSEDIKKACAVDQYRSYESTVDGRIKLISMMTKKDKINKLKSLGIDPTEEDKKNLDKLLLEIWNEEMEYKEG